MVEAPGLSARPPTPPKASSRTLPRDENDCAQDSPIFQTPGDSPRVANGSAAPSTRTSKKVNFSLSPKFIKPPTFTNSDSKPYSDIKVLTPSNECKPVKSILKATQSPVPVGRPNAPPDTPESFAMLLESVTQQLAGESMSARLDAYMQLFGALMAYDGLPSEQEMSGKLGLVSEFIQRDLIKSSGHGGPLDTNLAIQALKLSVAFIWSPGISAHLSDDFRIFLIDYSISCLQDDQVPKSVVTHWMSILSTQSFPPRIMTNTRMTRALTVLHELTKRVKGNSIISQRLSIYQRFLNQAKSAFVSQAALWMEHLVAGLLYHKKESRIKAISLGFQISNTFGPNQSLSKSVREVLDRPIEGGTTKMVSEVIGRLQVMMNLPDGAAHVPQAWSIVILLLRSKNLSLDQWEHFKNWVLVLQKCFNRNESSIKAQAILGWNRFVFAISPNESTSPSLLKMLRKPILSQFERKKQDKNATQPTQLALSSYYNLLYYAFRPSAPHSHVDAVWEEYVSGPAVNTFALSPALCDPFSQALANLLWSPQGKVWVENRATETNKIDPEELPSLDCRWIRSRISSVLKVFENILKSSVWDNDTIEKSNIAAAWISLSKSLSYASSKEITPSTESMQAVAHILGLLQRIWKAGPPSLNAAVDQPMDCFFDRFQFLSTTMIYSIGSIPFTEKLLLKATDETFQIANTPTHRHPRGDSNLVSPIVHLLQLISDKHDMAEISSSYVHLVDGILGAACGGRASRGSRLELLRQCAELYSMEDGFPFGVDHFRLVVWKTTARLAAETLSTFPTESTRERDGSVPRDYENILKILSIGLRFSDYLQAWNQLLNSFIQVVKSERGDLVIAAMVIEPVAEYVMRYGAPVYLPSVTLITHALTAPYPESLRDTEEPGSSIVAYTARPGQPTFPHRLLELAGKVLQGSYSGFTSSDASRVADLFESLASFLGCGALNYRSLILEHLQGSLALWLKDEAQHLGPEPGKESRILSSCDTLLSAIQDTLRLSTPHDTSTLHKFGDMISAALDSRHVLVAKSFKETWDSTFGLQESLECPESVSRALEKLENLGSQPQLSDPKVGNRRNTPKPREKTRNPQSVPSPGETTLLKASIEPSASLNSPSVTAAKESPRAAPSENPVENDPQRQKNPINRENEKRSPAIGSERSRRSELFSMIANLRSSSPATSTPKEFKTPPHLRNLRNAEPEGRIPPTPTLPNGTADNEEVFLGSSPTPGTRDRTQVSAVPSSLAARNNNTDMDPPSSPPIVRSLSPNTHDQPKPTKSTGNERKETENPKGATASKNSTVSISTPVTIRKQDKDADGSKQNSKTNKRSTARPRSASGRFIKSPKLREPDPSPSKEPRDPDRTQSAKSDLGETASASKSAPRNKKSRVQCSESRAANENDSGDDIETQIASQLGQDLELAVDSDEVVNAEESELPSTYSMTKKRKREVEQTHAPPAKERRRSSRRLSNMDSTEDAQIRTIRTRSSTLARPTDPATKPSPVGPGPKKRKGRSEKTTGDLVPPKPADGHAQDDQATPADQTQSTEGGVESTKSSEPIQKRRKSSRLGGHTDSQGSEDTPVQAKLPPSRSRKRGTKGKKGRSSLQKAKESSAEETTQTSDLDKHGIDGTSSDNITQGRSEDPSQSSEELPDAQTNTPDPQTERSPIQEDSQPQDPETGTDNGTNQQGDPTDSQGRQAENDKDDAAILRSLRGVLDDVKAASMNMDTLKEMDNLLFEIRVQAHDALRRQSR